jgi:hypothetical protein
MTGVEAAGAGAKKEYKILIDGEEGTSTANMMADTTQRHGRGTDSVIRDLDHDHTIVNGGEMTTVSLGGETTLDIEVAHLTGVRSIDGAMTITTDTSEDDKADVESGHIRRHTPVKKLYRKD